MKRLSELRAGLVMPKMLQTLAVGFLMAAIVVIHCIALATIVFNGPLLPFALQGVGMMLFGSIVFCLLIGSTSSYPGAIACPQEIPATILGTLGATIAASTVSGQGETAFMTMAALLMVSSILTGLCFFVIGHFRLGNFFRFIPYPVAGGFFVGTGCVVILASLSVMSGSAVGWNTLPRLLHDGIIWQWAPGVIYGLFLIIITNRSNSFVSIIGSVILVSVLYHAGLVFLDISLEDAQARGLLLSGISQSSALWPAFGISDLMNVDWSIIVGHILDLLTITLITLICLLVYVNGLEVSTGISIDLNREFRIAGIAGLFSGTGGSSPGCHSFAYTLIGHKFGIDTPWLGIIAASTLR